jgi:hypothetical protein
MIPGRWFYGGEGGYSRKDGNGITSDAAIKYNRKNIGGKEAVFRIRLDPLLLGFPDSDPL